VIGLKQLASLVAGALVLVSGAFIPAGDQGPVAVETLENGDKSVEATNPAVVSVNGLEVYEVRTPDGELAPGETMKGEFATVQFLAAATDTAQTTTIGGRTIDVDPGSHVTLESFSGTLDSQGAREGLTLTLTGTAEGMTVDKPENPRVSAYAGSEPTRPY